MSDFNFNRFTAATEFPSGTPYGIEYTGTLGLPADSIFNSLTVEPLQSILSGAEDCATMPTYGTPDQLLHGIGPVADNTQLAPFAEGSWAGLADAAVGGLVGELLGAEATPPLTDASTLSPASSRDSPPNQNPSLLQSPLWMQDGGSPALAGFQGMDFGLPGVVHPQSTDGANPRFFADDLAANCPVDLRQPQPTLDEDFMAALDRALQHPFDIAYPLPHLDDSLLSAAEHLASPDAGGHVAQLGADAAEIRANLHHRQLGQLAIDEGLFTAGPSPGFSLHNYSTTLQPSRPIGGHQHFDTTQQEGLPIYPSMTASRPPHSISPLQHVSPDPAQQNFAYFVPHPTFVVADPPQAFFNPPDSPELCEAPDARLHRSDTFVDPHRQHTHSAPVAGPSHVPAAALTVRRAPKRKIKQVREGVDNSGVRRRKTRKMNRRAEEKMAAPQAPSWQQAVYPPPPLSADEALIKALRTGALNGDLMSDGLIPEDHEGERATLWQCSVPNCGQKIQVSPDNKAAEMHLNEMHSVLLQDPKAPNSYLCPCLVMKKGVSTLCGQSVSKEGKTWSQHLDAVHTRSLNVKCRFGCSSRWYCRFDYIKRHWPKCKIGKNFFTAPSEEEL